MYEPFGKSILSQLNFSSVTETIWKIDLWEIDWEDTVKQQPTPAFRGHSSTTTPYNLALESRIL